ncbi:hypothetical protein PGB90_003038 [Kerria lacca]
MRVVFGASESMHIKIFCEGSCVAESMTKKMAYNSHEVTLQVCGSEKRITKSRFTTSVILNLLIFYIAIKKKKKFM